MTYCRTGWLGYFMGEMGSLKKSGKIDWENNMDALAGQGLSNFIQVMWSDFPENNPGETFARKPFCSHAALKMYPKHSLRSRGRLCSIGHFTKA